LYDGSNAPNHSQRRKAKRIGPGQNGITLGDRITFWDAGHGKIQRTFPVPAYCPRISTSLHNCVYVILYMKKTHDLAKIVAGIYDNTHKAKVGIQYCHIIPDTLF